MSTSQSYVDKALFQRIAQGDEPAFEQLFHTYVPQVLPVLTNITGNEAASKDIAQEVFLKVWINRYKLEEVREPRTWLFTLVYRQAYSWLKQQKLRERTAEAAGGPDGRLSPETAESYTRFRETGELVRAAILRLPPQQQKIYRLSREGHLSIPQIAEQLGLSPNTVKNTLVTALRSIRAYLEQHDILLPVILAVIFLS